MTNIHKLEKFNFHLYVISETKSNNGPVKIGYSNHPPSRLKEIQTGNPNRLTIWGSISVKQKKTVELIEKIIHSHLKNNKLHAHGEWFNLNVKDALSMLETFPLSREDLTKGVGDKFENTIDLPLYAWNKKIINEDEYDILQEAFENGDSEENYEFNNFTYIINP